MIDIYTAIVTSLIFIALIISYKILYPSFKAVRVVNHFNKFSSENEDNKVIIKLSEDGTISTMNHSSFMAIANEEMKKKGWHKYFQDTDKYFLMIDRDDTNSISHFHIVIEIKLSDLLFLKPMLSDKIFKLSTHELLGEIKIKGLEANYYCKCHISSNEIREMTNHIEEIYDEE